MTSGKTALITGGSRGIGRAVARKLAEMGMNIAIVYAGNQQAAEETLEMCRNAGVEARAWQLDVADFEAAKQTVAQVREAFGSIDVLVNNAGITQDGLVAMMKEADFDDPSAERTHRECLLRIGHHGQRGTGELFRRKGGRNWFDKNGGPGTGCARHYGQRRGAGLH